VFQRTISLCLSAFLLQAFVLTAQVSAQEPVAPTSSTPAQSVIGAQGSVNATLPQQSQAVTSAQGQSAVATQSQSLVAPQSQPFEVPAGTRLPLVLRNGINTRTAKVGDSIYFETIYPIAVNNRIVIPIGSFLRGQLLESKRPGFVKGRGEIRMVLDQMTFPNGYTVTLAAIPNSVDRNGQEGVDKEGTIKGPSSAKRDVGLLLVATGGGAYIGTLAGAIENGAAGTGALIGSGVGAAAAVIAILATRGPEAELPRGTTLDVVFDRPLMLDAGLLPANEVGHLSSPLSPVTDSRDANQREGRHRRSLIPFPPLSLRF
jgi:hypothetical protein